MRDVDVIIHKLVSHTFTQRIIIWFGGYTSTPDLIKILWL
jgi:hypothetical protein